MVTFKFDPNFFNLFYISHCVKKMCFSLLQFQEEARMFLTTFHLRNDVLLKR